MSRLPLIALGLTLPLIAACTSPGGFDFDMRNNGITSATPAASETAPRPEPDQFGLITYPTYQVVVARRGDILSTVANRIGMDAGELARFNGREQSDLLRDGEVLALPRRITPPGGGSANDITAIASAAIDRADADSPAASGPSAPAPVEVQGGAEPVRHRVARGETAYSVARLYGVSVRSLADWNGLGPDLTVHEGQFLIIPLVLDQAAPEADGGTPGNSVTPVPPSAAEPLPDDIQTAELPDAPDMQAPTPTPDETAEETASNGPQMQRPVPGAITRPYSSGNEGIDIAASVGTPVRAAADGTVAAITRDTDQVPILVLRHPGNLLTVYANIDNIRVERGDQITRGQNIADVGTGDPAFLHFEVRQGFDSVDPTPYIE
ncbi:peptidoglycan DD-metalloendopeptidase family protein [Nioella nitratireducens]|uniref:peptidoglycan DD-metalloendopeptidase family protein n=1 Tax=Nioella nitratireducens TaxID=1287720 RepID=UPI0008FD68C3|nr:M23 family metallopeptidase [Nioella nitratireducens]